jgi:hypothetical protein
VLLHVAGQMLPLYICEGSRSKKKETVVIWKKRDKTNDGIIGTEMREMHTKKIEGVQ